MVVAVNEQDFSQTVLASPVPVLVSFWAPWCGVCHLLKPFLSKYQKEWEGKLQMVEINADDNFRLAHTYRLRSLPTLLVFHHGQLVQRLEGLQEREMLQHTLENLYHTLCPTRTIDPIT